MIKRPDTRGQRIKRHNRVRGKISGTAERPRLCVFRSENHIYAQIIDDVAGNTLVSASSVEKGFEGKGGNVEAIKADTEAVEKSFYKISEKLYQQQQAQPGADGAQGFDPGAQQGGQDGTYYNANYEDHSDNKN